MHDETSPVFKLAELVHLYKSRMERLGIKHGGRVHTDRLKQKMLAHFLNMCAQHQAGDVLTAFNENPGDALAKASELDRDLHVVQLVRAVQIVRLHIIGDA